VSAKKKAKGTPRAVSKTMPKAAPKAVLKATSKATPATTPKTGPKAVFETVSQVFTDPVRRKLRNSIIAVVLAIALASGMLLLGMALGRAGSPTSAQGTSAGTDVGAASTAGLIPTGGETVINPEEDYSCPRGGSFQFIGAGFSPGATLSVRIEGSDGVLGSFSVDAEGFIIGTDPNASYEQVIIPEQTAPGLVNLEFVYEGERLGTVLTVEVTANPYQASMEITRDANSGARVLRVMSEDGTWAPGAEVFLTIDHKDSPIYGVFEVEPDGTFDGLMTLPDEIASGTHIFTLSAAETTVDGVLYPDASVSESLLL
jgi:hypothetical protein